MEYETLNEKKPGFCHEDISNVSIVNDKRRLREKAQYTDKKGNEKLQSESDNLIYKSKPGITGIGSIIFRDEEKWISNFKGDKHQFYKNKIAPYKSQLELWYLKNSSLLVDLKLIIITVWVILFPKSTIVEKIFKNLPDRPIYLN